MTVLTGWFKIWVLKTRCLRRENHELQNSFWEMKVMLTPPDLWGDTGGPGAAQTMYQVQDVTLSALSVFSPDDFASGETQLWGWWPSVGRRQGDSSREHHPHQQAEAGQSAHEDNCSALLKLCVIYFCKLFVSIKLQVGIWQKCSIPTKIALDEASRASRQTAQFIILCFLIKY